MDIVKKKSHASRSTLLWPHRHLTTIVHTKPENRSEIREYIYANVQTTTSKARLQENLLKTRR